MLRVTLIFLAKTNYIPSSFTLAGICPHFCHTYFHAKRVELIRPKDTWGQHSYKLKSNQGGWAGLLDLWPGERAIVQSEKKLLCWCGLNLQGSPVVTLAAWYSEEALPASIASDRMMGKSLSFILFPLFWCSLVHLVFSSCLSNSWPIWIHKPPVPRSLLAPGDA